MTVGSVHFTPCARTAWHRHSTGQTLYVTEGEGRVQSRGGPVIAIRPGDIIRIAGGEWLARRSARPLHDRVWRAPHRRRVGGEEIGVEHDPDATGRPRFTGPVTLV